VQRAKNSLHEWMCMQKSRQSSQGTHQQTLWEKPSPPVVICNVDCALFNNNTITSLVIKKHIITGLGICFRESSRALLLDFSKSSYFNSTPLEAQVLDLFEAINIDINRHVTYVIFKFDYRLLVDTINSNSTPHNEFGDIISRCTDQLSSRNNFIVSYARSQENNVAHNIVRASLSNPSLHIFHDVSSHLYPLLFHKMN
jgi:hypothetical protein